MTPKQLAAYREAELTEALDDLAVAVALGHPPQVLKHELRVGRIVGEAQALSALLGAEGLIQRVRQSDRNALGAQLPRILEQPRRTFQTAPITEVTFWNAIEAITGREPVLARSGPAMVQAILRGSFAVGAAATTYQTERVQGVIAQAMLEGHDRREAVSRIREDEGWSHGYAQTVFRTNVMRAYSDGTRRIAQQPELEGLVAAFRFRATLDSNVRINHRNAHGFAARPNDPAWNELTPPLGFNCRCSIRPMMRGEARRAFGGDVPLNIPVPQGAGPDPGFVIQAVA